MTDLRSDFVGSKSPNPFRPASAPPTDKACDVEHAFRAVWGEAVVEIDRSLGT
jgi:dihydropyrimidine dehydrogenase (NAD+) subunit PreA